MFNSKPLHMRNTNKINCRPILVFNFVIGIFFIIQNLNAQPVIQSFSPVTGVIGTSVIIKGKNFNPIAEKNTVYFGATKAVLSNAPILRLQL
jgi:hypothetical protein